MDRIPADLTIAPIAGGWQLVFGTDSLLVPHRTAVSLARRILQADAAPEDLSSVKAAGALACVQAQPLDANPWPVGGSRHAAWDEGWKKQAKRG